MDDFLESPVKKPFSWFSSPSANVIRLGAVVRATEIRITEEDLTFIAPFGVGKRLLHFFRDIKDLNASLLFQFPSNPFKG